MKVSGILGEGNGVGLVVSGTAKNPDQKKEGSIKENQLKNGSINGSNLMIGENDRIGKKLEEARQKAGKVIQDQFARDNVTTDQLKLMRDKVQELNEEVKSLKNSKKEMVSEKENLKSLYGIEADSQEQKDLELIEKAKDLEKQFKLGDLTKEELDRLEQMPPLTEYQIRSLSYKGVIDNYSELIQDAQDVIAVLGKAISGTKNGMLKQHGMDDALKAADAIQDAASGAAIGMMFEDARKHIEEEFQKLVDAAKEAAAKKEEEQKKLEESKPEDKETEELTEDIQESGVQKDKLMQEMDQILKNLELDEDKKGLLVDSLL